uniref:TonB family protein n=1 Tax=Casimicrobium huifangae TaxID=2591109 RepID=UPI0037831FB5
TAAREIKLVNRVEPIFPRGVDAERGTVRARLQLNAGGAVTGVEIVEANPRRVFDRAVSAALQQWRYEPTGEAFSTMAEISFSR